MKPRVISLFAGVEGFGLGFTQAGAQVIAACEIDPQARSVIAYQHPDTPLHDDVTTFDTMAYGPADVIVGGSPCQDLSVAGKRRGIRFRNLTEYLAIKAERAQLRGQDTRSADEQARLDELDALVTRSGLFMEQVRIIHEMRAATNGTHPRFAVWENVPGSYSSHKGEDFASVLSALLQADVPVPASGKWAHTGVVRVGGRELAWRTVDSQFFGVPQRRRRVYVVVDFGGERAHEVLLEPRRVRGDSAPGAEAGADAARAAARRAPGGGQPDALIGSFQQTSFAGKGTEGFDPATRVLRTVKPQGDHQMLLLPALAVDCRNDRTYEEISGTLQSKNQGGHSLNYQNPVAVPVVINQQGSNVGVSELAGTLTTGVARGTSGPLLAEPSTYRLLAFGKYAEDAVSSTVQARDGKGATDLIVERAFTFAQNSRDEVRLQGGGQLVGALAAQPGMHQTTFVAHPDPLAFECKHPNVQSGPVTPTLRSMNNVNSNVSGGGHVAVVFPVQDGRGLDKAQNGLGLGGAGSPAYTLDTTGAQAAAIAFAMRGREEGNVPEVHGTGEQVGALRASSGGSTRDFVATSVHLTQDPIVGEEFTPCLTRGTPEGAATIGVMVPHLATDSGLASTLTADQKGQRGPRGDGSDNLVVDGDVQYVVRRLMPLECERLQAFPDDWTAFGLVEGQVKAMPDTARYRFMGNAITVAVVRWIAVRMMPFLS